MPRKLTTDFIKIATSGSTIDGRVITEQQIKEMGDAYDREDYTATITYEHIKYFGNMGLVQDVKWEKDGKGRVSLYARLTPSDDLIYLNRNGQKLFTSIEMNPEFADTGKAYLMGLAVTDSPASLGTDELHFSNRKQDKDNMLSNPVRLDELAFPESKSFFNRLFGGDHDPQSEEFMSKELLEKISARLDSLSDKVDEFSVKDTDGDEPEAPPSDDDSNSVDAEKFSKLLDSLESLTNYYSSLSEQHKDLKKDFSALKNTLDEQAPGTPDGEDTGPDEELVL